MIAKIKNIGRGAMLSVLLTSVVGCTNISDINENPNDPEYAPIEHFMIDLVMDVSDLFLEQTLNLTNKYVQQTVWPQYHWYYNLDTRYFGEEWWTDGYYANISTVDYILDNATEGYEDYTGMALVVKSWMGYILTSMYGDVPYSEAGQADDGISKPKYDTQQEVFTAILEDLETANSLLGTGAFALDGDFLLDNDATKWKKFANSLRMRVLIAQSGQVDPSTELSKIINDPTTYPIMESNDDQPVFSYNADCTYPFNEAGSHYSQYSFMCSTFVDKLLAYDDDRLYYFAGKTTADGAEPYAGIAEGSESDPLPGVASGYTPFLLCSVDNYALESVWMTYAEVEFIIAEAAQRGWISGGSTTAAEHYYKGIQASYEYCAQINASGMSQSLDSYEVDAMRSWSEVGTSYLAQPGVVYSGTSDELLQAIAEQKWIALFYDVENWFSYRRTGLPAMTFSPDQQNNGVLPLRYKYPQDDKTFNTDNYNAAVASQGADDWSTVMWILK